jgi:hypothetical protein
MPHNPFDDDENSSSSSSGIRRPMSEKHNPFADSFDEQDVVTTKKSSSGNSKPSMMTRRAHTTGNAVITSSSTTTGPLDPFESTTTTQQQHKRAVTNPFEFDEAFRSSTDSGDQTTPILTGMDAATSSNYNNNKRTSSTADALRRASQVVTNQWLAARSSAATGGEHDSNKIPTLLAGSSSFTPSPTKLQQKRKKKIPQWPFDTYHSVQQVYYETIDSHDDDEDNFMTTTPGSSSASPFTQQQEQAQSSSLTSSFRPEPLPDIPTAVQNLPLVDFEKKAQERAIQIVSTWIYDEALMDELWVVVESSSNEAPTTIDDNVSVKTSEGVELSPSGVPLLVEQPSSLKMDKEIMKLRESTGRELALINARLNDGVAASGTEVQELVHAVTKTKGDLGKLRELTTYLSSQGSSSSMIEDSSSSSMALLMNYPRLKTAIHARRNLARCFRELDFFAQIPATCDRLRDEMHHSEWTEHEWQTLRSVCREHVELEVFLVEAEAGMKKRIDADGTTGDRSSYRHANPGRNVVLSNSRGGGGGLGKTHDSVDRFLEEHAANVWELGDEIKLRVLSGVGTTFDLALNNPAGMVALVEAIELYEGKAAEYKESHGTQSSSWQRLHFTEMRRSALEKICQDFEERGLHVFQEVQQMVCMLERETYFLSVRCLFVADPCLIHVPTLASLPQAADEAGEDAATAAFNATLKASNELTHEMDFVHNQMAPCFPQDWAVEALWTSVVARVSSQNLFQQIGGRDGHRLHTLTVTQLLDLVAWIENFFERIQDAFPDIDLASAINATPSNTLYDASGASLLHGDGKEIDVERAKDSVVSVSGAMVEVKQLAQTEFIARTQLQTEEWLVNVYKYVVMMPLSIPRTGYRMRWIANMDCPFSLSCNHSQRRSRQDTDGRRSSDYVPLRRHFLARRRPAAHHSRATHQEI